MMRKRFSLSAAFALPLVLSCALLATAARAEDVLRVNGAPITLEQIELANAAAASNPALQQQVAKQLLQQELLAQTVRGLSPEQTQRLDAAVQNLKRQALAQLAAENYWTAHPVDDAAVKAEYDKIVAGLPAEQYWLRWIVVKTPDEANAVLDALRSGKTGFAALAVERSIGQNAELGGALGWQSEQTLPAAVLGVVRKLKPGQVAGPIALDNGFAIVQLLATRQTPKPTLDQLKPQIEQQLRNEALQAYIQQLAKSAKIDNLIQPAAASSPAAKESGDGK